MTRPEFTNLGNAIAQHLEQNNTVDYIGERSTICDAMMHDRDVFIDNKYSFIVVPKQTFKRFKLYDNVLKDLEKSIRGFVSIDEPHLGIEKQHFSTFTAGDNEYERFGSLKFLELLGTAAKQYHLNDTLGNHVKTVSGSSSDRANEYNIHIIPFPVVAGRALVNPTYAIEIRKNQLKEMGVKVPRLFFW